MKKKVPTKRREHSEATPEEKEKKVHLKNKGAFAERNNKTTPGKRQFDRQSGTGRGKEIAKGGAGGKHTWGANPKNVARDESSNYDDDLFHYALNPKPKKTVEEETPKEVEEIVKEEPQEQAPQVEVVEKTENAKEEGFDRRRKRKGFEEEEVKKEDLLERPENALSYAEYMQKLKEKNQSITETRTKTAPVVENSDLKAQTRTDEEFTIGLKDQNVNKKQKNKPKEKKTEEKPNVDFTFMTEEVSEKRFETREKTQGKKKGPKFQFVSEEFPEL